MAVKTLVHGVADVRVEVDRINDLDVRDVIGEAAQCPADGGEAATEALPAMGRDENDAPSGRESGERTRKDVVFERDDVPKCVDNRVARHEHRRRIGSLAQEIAASAL